MRRHLVGKTPLSPTPCRRGGHAFASPSAVSPTVPDRAAAKPLSPRERGVGERGRLDARHCAHSSGLRPPSPTSREGKARLNHRLRCSLDRSVSIRDDVVRPEQGQSQGMGERLDSRGGDWSLWGLRFVGTGRRGGVAREGHGTRKPAMEAGFFVVTAASADGSVRFVGRVEGLNWSG